MATPDSGGPEVPILLLGDGDVGKSTFLARLTMGTQGASVSGDAVLPTLRDLDQPFVFNIRMYNRPYRFHFYDTASPEHYTLLRPALVVLCYSIADPQSLRSIYEHWKMVVEETFNLDEEMPVILLGLKRDVRSREDYDGRVKPSYINDVAIDNPILGPKGGAYPRAANGHEEGTLESDAQLLNPRKFVYPQEALRVAQEMRLDRYCECSALTGELCREVIEDIARTAAMTTTAKGGRSDSTYCSVM